MNIVREIRSKWKPRKASSHKGDYGRVFILAGSKGLTGAAHLAGMAALRAGAGLVTVGVPDAVYPVIARREAEVMVKGFPSNRSGSLSFKSEKSIRSFLHTQDVAAMGPGLSQNRETQKLVRLLIQKNKHPLVLDADALNALKGHTKLLKRSGGQTLLTPHPGEFVRLFGGRLSNQIADRKKKAAAAAHQTRCTVVLKGHHTVVASPEGKIYINPTGNPGMASGGTGDVLTGMIAALLGQGFNAWDAARFGVYLHGLAGDLAARKAGEISLTAGDVLEHLNAAIQKTLHTPIRGRKK